MAQQLLVIGNFDRLVKELVIVAAIVEQSNRRLIGELFGLNEVLAPQFNRIHLQIAGSNIDQPFHDVARFWATGPAVGIDRHGIGHRAIGFAKDDRNFIEAREEGDVNGGGNQRRKGGEVGPHIGIGGDIQAEHGAVIFQRQFTGGHMVTAMRIGDKGFAAGGDPLHRAVKLTCSPRHDHFFGIVEDLAAETTTDIGRNHAQLIFRHMQGRNAEQQANDVRVLARRPDR